jgi:precorrin-6B methylase 2
VRVVPAAVLVLAAACGRGSSDSNPSPGSSTPDPTRDQARFDAERRPDKVIEALAIGPGSQVADIGAYTGQLTVHVARAVRPGGHVVATDIDNQVLDKLNTRLTQAGVADVLETRVVAPDHPGLEPGPYDAILLSEVDQELCARHVDGPPCSKEDVARWVGEALPVLKPNGRIVITNKVQFKASSLAAMRAAGLVLAHETTPVPTHFIATFTKKR